VGGEQIHFRGTTFTFAGDSNPDPSDWLGGFRASESVYSLESTLTANQDATSRHIILDSSEIGSGDGVYNGWWLLMRNGPAADQALMETGACCGKIIAFDSATGAFKLDRQLGAAAQTGDAYALFEPGAIFPNVDPVQAFSGEARYRALALHNETGGAVNGVELFFVDLGEGDISDFAKNSQQSDVNLATGHMVDELTKPTNQWGGNLWAQPAPDSMKDSHGWQSGISSITGQAQVSVPNGNSMSIYLERIIRPNRFSRASQAILVVANSTTGGDDPDPLMAGLILTFDIVSEVPKPSVTIDRDQYIGGGGIVISKVVGAASGSPLFEIPVHLRVRPPEGLGSITTSGEPYTGYSLTDEDGIANGVYSGPTDPADAGKTTALQAIVSGGVEEWDPKPSTFITTICTAEVEATGASPPGANRNLARLFFPTT